MIIKSVGTAISKFYWQTFKNLFIKIKNLRTFFFLLQEEILVVDDYQRNFELPFGQKGHDKLDMCEIVTTYFSWVYITFIRLYKLGVTIKMLLNLVFMSSIHTDTHTFIYMY